jgi:hypothetical protein
MKAIGIVLVATMAACQATTSSSGPSTVKTVTAGDASFARYQTFGFRLAERPPAPYELSARSFEVERRVHDLIAEELVRRGYTEATPKPDFLIRLSSGTARADKVEPTTTSGGNENEPQSVTAGEIVVDAFDGSTGQQVWHGTAEALIDPQRINERALDAAVGRMLATIPVRSGAASNGTTFITSATIPQ